MLSLIARSPPSSTVCGSRLVGSEPSAIEIDAPATAGAELGALPALAAPAAATSAAATMPMPSKRCRFLTMILP